MTTHGRSEPTPSFLAVCGVASFALGAGCAERRADGVASEAKPLTSLSPVSATTVASGAAPATLPVESVAVVEASAPAITLSKDAWRLQASLHPGNGRFTFIVSGRVAAGGRSGESRAGDAHWVTLSSAAGTGPMSIVVEDPSGKSQTRRHNARRCRPRHFESSIGNMVAGAMSKSEAATPGPAPAPGKRTIEAH